MPGLPDLGQPQRQARARRLEEVPDAILEAVDLAIDGGRLGGLPSTVVDIAAIDAGGGWEILRQGAISEGDLASALARVGLD